MTWEPRKGKGMFHEAANRLWNEMLGALEEEKHRAQILALVSYE